jgi:hypothetical protein
LKNASRLTPPEQLQPTIAGQITNPFHISENFEAHPAIIIPFSVVFHIFVKPQTEDLQLPHVHFGQCVNSGALIVEVRRCIHYFQADMLRIELL